MMNDHDLYHDKSLEVKCQGQKGQGQRSGKGQWSSEVNVKVRGQMKVIEGQRSNVKVGKVTVRGQEKVNEGQRSVWQFTAMTED